MDTGARGNNMKPYYQRNDIQLYCGDCREVLPNLSGPFQLLLTDPPYSRVKDDEWDRIDHHGLENLLRSVFAAIAPQMAKNGAVYCFCWPNFSARLQHIMGDYFNVLNEIIWMKRRQNGSFNGMAAKKSLENCRIFFPETERIVFAEMYGIDKHAEADAGYQKASEQLWAELMRPLIRYFQEAKKESGLSGKEIQERMLQLTGKRYVFDRHTFSESQWGFPVREQYEAAATFMPLRRQYDELRRQYDALRRPHRPKKSNFTDLWHYQPILPGKPERVHNCQKPMDMIIDMLETSSRPGDWVIDLFAGSGTTGAASLATGRRAVLIEQDERYCEVIADRLENFDPLFHAV